MGKYYYKLGKYELLLLSLKKTPENKVIVKCSGLDASIERGLGLADFEFFENI